MLFTPAGHGTSLATTPWRCVYSPVHSEARAGPQIGFAQYAWRKRTPDCASPSRAGVRASLWPSMPITPGLCWSEIRNNTLGGRPCSREVEEVWSAGNAELAIKLRREIGIVHDVIIKRA